MQSPAQTQSNFFWRAALRLFLRFSPVYDRLRDKLMISGYGGLHPKNVFSFRSEFFLRNVGPEDRVIDIACGSGAILGRLSTRVAFGVGIDWSDANLALCRKFNAKSNLEFRKMDVLEADYAQLQRETQFGVAIFSHILEHVEDVPTLLKKVAARRILICVPSQENWKTQMLIDLGINHHTDPTHFREYTREMLEKELAQAGYQVQEMGFNSEGEIACSAILQS